MRIYGRLTMFNPENSASWPSDSEKWPSAYELQRRARRERSEVVNALLRSAVGQFAQWLRVLVINCAQLPGRVKAELQRRREMRALEQLDDRMLADIGVARCEIDSAVRFGLWRGTTLRALPRRRVRSHVVPERRAA